LVILRLAGVDLSPLTVIGGAFSFGVGFGLQTIIQNFVAGLIILAERPIKIGDRIQVGDVVGDLHHVRGLLRQQEGHGDLSRLCRRRQAAVREP